jgi:hypothetical protein
MAKPGQIKLCSSFGRKCLLRHIGMLKHSNIGDIANKYRISLKAID